MNISRTTWLSSGNRYLINYSEDCSIKKNRPRTETFSEYEALQSMQRKYSKIPHHFRLTCKINQQRWSACFMTWRNKELTCTLEDDKRNKKRNVFWCLFLQNLKKRQKQSSANLCELSPYKNLQAFGNLFTIDFCGDVHYSKALTLLAICLDAI